MKEADSSKPDKLLETLEPTLGNWIKEIGRQRAYQRIDIGKTQKVLKNCLLEFEKYCLLIRWRKIDSQDVFPSRVVRKLTLRNAIASQEQDMEN